MEPRLTSCCRAELRRVSYVVSTGKQRRQGPAPRRDYVHDSVQASLAERTNSNITLSVSHSGNRDGRRPTPLAPSPGIIAKKGGPERRRRPAFGTTFAASAPSSSYGGLYPWR